MRLSLLIFLSFSGVSTLFSQSTNVSPCDKLGSGPGVFINEIGNTVPYSNAEYIELVVLGDTDSPTTEIDLSGWIIDDNSSGIDETGHEPGHIQFGPCFNNLPPGTIVLIYNDKTTIPGINPSNDGMPNDLGFWQIPFRSSCLVGVYGPNHHHSNRHTEDFFEPTTEKKGWGEYIPMRNRGDALQIRRENGELFHSLYWGLISKSPQAGYMIYEESSNPSSVNLNTLELSNTSVQLIGDSFLNAGQYVIKKDNGTPGFANSELNRMFIESQASLDEEFADDRNIIFIHHEVWSESESIGEEQLTDIYFEAYGPSEENIVETIFPGVIYESIGIDQWIVHDLPSGTYDFRFIDICGTEHLVSIVIALKKNELVCLGECIEVGEDRGEEFCYLWGPEEYFTEEELYLPVITFCPTESTILRQNITDSDGNEYLVEYEISTTSGDGLISPDPIILCEDDIVTLEVPDDFESYQWSHSSAETSHSTVVSYENFQEFETISVSVIDSDGCLLTDDASIFDGLEEEEILSYFTNKGFLIIPGIFDIINGIAPPPPDNISGPPTDCNVNYDGEIVFSINIFDNVETVNISELLEGICLENESEYNYFITDNESFCSRLSEIMVSMESAIPTNWYHILEGENGTNYFIIGSNVMNFLDYNNFFGSPFHEEARAGLDALTIQDESVSSTDWAPLTWTILESLANEYADLWNRAQTKYPQVAGERNAAYFSYKMRLGNIMEHAALTALDIKKNTSGLRYIPSSVGSGRTRIPDGVAGQSETLRAIIPDVLDLQVRWPKEEQVLLHEVKISKGNSILFEPEYRRDPKQLPDFTLSFSTPRTSIEYPSFAEFWLADYIDIERYRGEEVIRSPTATYAGGIHLITLANNNPDFSFIDACSTNHVVLPHSYFEYRISQDGLLVPFVEIRLKYREQHAFLLPKPFREYIAIGETGFGPFIDGRLLGTKKSVTLNWNKGSYSW